MKISHVQENHSTLKPFTQGILISGLLSIGAWTQAQPYDDEETLLDLYGDEELLSIATGRQQSIAQAPAVASVITARDIDAMGATGLDEVLETVPGLHVAIKRSGYDPIYAFRGVHSEYNPQVLVLVNGIPLSNLFNGDRNSIWGDMPVKAISRIEIIRGPGSAVYGADAFAGVINIITKTRRDIKDTELGVRGGSYNTRDFWFLHGADIQDFEVAFMLEYHKTDGHNEIIDLDAQSTLDAIFGTSASLAPGPVSLSRDNLDLRLDVHRGRWRLRAGLQQRRDWGLGAGAAGALSPSSRYRSDRWSVDASYHNTEVKKNWELSAQFSYLDTSQETETNLIIFPEGTNLGAGVYPDGFIGNPEVFERHSRADISAFYTGVERHQVRMGLGYYYGDIYKTQESKNFGPDPGTGTPLPANSDLVDVSDTNLIFLPETDRSNYYSFLQDIWQLAPDWELTSGIRVDRYSDFGTTTNPRLALVWSTRRDLTTKLLYSRAFRSPSITETHLINNPVVLGNPDLDPETMESYELAFDYHPTSELRLALNLFSYRWDDIINFIPDPNAPTSTAQNNGRQTGKGAELEFSWKYNTQIKLSGNYALQKAKDEETSNDASETPQQQLYLALNWQLLPHWNMNTQVNRVLDRKREYGDNRRDLKDYTLVSFTLRYQQTNQPWALSLALRNALNSEAREPSPWSNPAANIPNDLPLARQNFLIQAEYSF